MTQFQPITCQRDKQASAQGVGASVSERCYTSGKAVLPGEEPSSKSGER